MPHSNSAAKLAALLLAGGFSMQAGSYTVKPVRIELSAKQLRTTIQIQNLGDDPTTIQAHVVAWNANGTEEVLSDNDEILLNPPIFTIAIGHAQFLRLGLRHPLPDLKEGTYRLILEEVPPPPKPGFNGLNTVLKISVPIFVKPRIAAPQLAWSLQRTSDQEVRLSVQNRGNTHVQIRKLAVTAADASEPGFVQGTVTYVLQNARKEWVIRNAQLAGAGTVRLHALTDNGDIREDLVQQRCTHLTVVALCLSAFSPYAEGAAAIKENLLMVRVNGVAVGDNEPVLELEPGRAFVPVGVFREGRLRLPRQRPTHVSALGLDFYPVDAIAGASYTVDQETQTLDITVPASAFTDTNLDGMNNLRATATRPDPGLFLNHDFQMLYSGGQQFLTGLVEGGFFSRLGVLTTEYAGPDLTNSFMPRRLTTQFFRDFPEAMTTLTIGDSFSAVSPWSRTVAYAGVRWASKFATQPSFIPTPLPAISGQASQPSTVDVYVDNVKRLSQPVAPGPFAIQNVPVISGQGEIRMVVTDILGRQQVITESYIRASNLLRRGVSDFTYEAGTIRLNYGIASNQYSSFFAAGTQRRGITDSLTVEGRLEIQPQTETLGLGAVYAIRRVGVVAGGAAASMDHGHPGELYYAQFSRSQHGFSFSAQVQMASDDFRQVGLTIQQKATKMLLQGQVSKSLGSGTSVAVGYLRRDGRTEQNAAVGTAALNVRLRRAFLTVGGTYSLLVPRQYGLNVVLVMPLGERTIAIASGDSNSNSSTASVEIDRSVPVGPGYGYRVRTTNLDQQRNEAGFYYQNSDGSYGIEAAQQSGASSLRFLERGSFVLLHRHVLVSRWLSDSFGVVEVPNTKGVPVYVNNQVLAKTDGRGLALLPWLVSYNRNTVRLDDASLPVDVTVDQEERTVVPMARSAVFLRYKPAVIGGATLVLMTAGGKPVPQGAKVTINGNPEAYEVELRGEVFAQDIDYPAAVHVEWEGGKCDVHIAKAPADTPVPRIGPLTCKEGK